MNINQFIEKLNTMNCPIFTKGEYSTFSEYFNNVVKPSLIKKEVVEEWDNLLNNYLQDNDAIIYLARYTKDNVQTNEGSRKGYLTVTDDGFKYAYVSNKISLLFYMMAYNSFIPSYEDFKEFMTNGDLCKYCFDNDENILDKNNSSLSYIYAPDQDYTFSYKNTFDESATRGKDSDWVDSKNWPYKTRNTPSLSSKAKDELKAIFLRLTSTINFFSEPTINIKESSSTDTFHLYLDNYLSNTYPSIYSNFNKNAAFDKLNTPFIDLDKIGSKQYNYYYDNTTLPSKEEKKEIETTPIIQYYTPLWLTEPMFSIVEYVLVPLLQNMELNDEIIDTLSSKEKCSEIFDSLYPLLSTRRLVDGQVRYFEKYAVPYKDKTYYTFSQLNDDSRDALISWILEHNKTTKKKAIEVSKVTLPEAVGKKEEAIIGSWINWRPAEIACGILLPIFKNNPFPDSLRDKLLDKLNSKHTFNINFAVLSEEQVVTASQNRCYVHTVNIGGHDYFFSSQWYDYSIPSLIEYIEKCYLDGLKVVIPSTKPTDFEGEVLYPTSTTPTKSEKNEEINKVSIKFDDDWRDNKISIIVQTTFTELLTSGIVSQDVIEKLSTQEYSKRTFGLSSYSVLNKERLCPKGKYRYYKNAIYIGNEKYYLCSQFIEPSKERLIHWMENYIRLDDSISTYAHQSDKYMVFNEAINSDSKEMATIKEKVAEKLEVVYFANKLSLSWKSENVGQIVNDKLRKIIEYSNLPETLISDLQDEEYSLKTFGLKYPLLSTDRYDHNGYARYYSNPVTVNGKTLYLCSQWYDNQKEDLISWIMNYNGEENYYFDEKEKINDVKEFIYKDEVKVGALANSKLRDMLENGSFSDEEIKKFQTVSYSHEVFGLNFPLIVTEDNENYSKERYYVSPLTIKGKKYYLTSQWYKGHKNSLINFINK